MRSGNNIHVQQHKTYMINEEWNNITFSVGSSFNLVRMFVMVKSMTISKMGHIGSKAKSLGQILEKNCVRSRGHIFCTIIMKLHQNILLDETSDEFENGSCRV